MSRTFAGFAFLLVAIAVPCAALRADEPGKPGDNKLGQGTVTIAGSNSYSRGTTITNGTLQLGSNLDWTPANAAGGLNLNGGGNTIAIAAMTPAAAAAQPGKVYYVITEGAGMGDSVRSFPCTGKETVLDAVSQMNGISQLSSTKMWIARPSPTSHDKSTILPVDWEAIAKRGINTTNYTLMPGDRFVVGEDPQVALSNLVNKKLAPVERLMGMVGLTCSTLNNWDNMPDADREALKGLVQRGVLTDDAGLKSILLEVARLHDLDRQNQKARPKEAEKSK
jgi:autotransporter-associated beta strand protein